MALLEAVYGVFKRRTAVCGISCKVEWEVGKTKVGGDCFGFRLLNGLTLIFDKTSAFCDFFAFIFVSCYFFHYFCTEFKLKNYFL